MPQPIAEILERLQREPIERSFQIDREAIDEDSRTVNVAFASSDPINHWFGVLELSMNPKHMRTDRLKAGAPLMMGHRTYDWQSHVGVIDGYEIGKDKVARADVRFSRSTVGEEIYRDVLDGIRQQVSVGFFVHDMKLVKQKKGEPDVYRSEDWEPFEISIVPVAADFRKVGVGRAANFLPSDPNSPSPTERDISRSNEETQMTPEEIAAAAAAEAARSVEAPQHQASPQLAVIREINDFAAQLGGQATAVAEAYRLQDGATVSGFLAAVRAAEATARANQPQVPVMDPHTAAARNGAPQSGIQLAHSISRHGVIRSFKGDDAAMKAYRFGKWLLGGPLGRRSAAEWCTQNGLTLQRDQSEGVNESGGYLVPEEFGNDLIDLREQYGVFRRNTKIVPMASDTHSDPRRTGGLTAVFEGEGDTGDVSTLGWDRVMLVAKKLMVLARYSSEISEDSLISMSDTLANEMAYAFANKEDECGFNGDGTSTYGGIVGIREAILGLSATRANIAGLVVGSGNAYSELVLTDFEAVVARLPEYADVNSAKWFVSRAFYYNVMVKLALATSGTAVSDVEAARNQRFLGYPVEFAQVMPKVDANDQVCAILGDLSKGSRMGTRRNTTISLSEHVLHSTDQIQVRGTERFDIKVHDVGNADATAANRVPGPIVALATAAA